MQARKVHINGVEWPYQVGNDRLFIYTPHGWRLTVSFMLVADVADVPLDKLYAFSRRNPQGRRRKGEWYFAVALKPSQVKAWIETEYLAGRRNGLRDIYKPTKKQWGRLRLPKPL